jgi:hypothetical protein
MRRFYDLCAMSNADATARPENFAPQVLDGGDATLVLDRDGRLSPKRDAADAGEPAPESEPGAEATTATRSPADEPLDALVLANRAKIAALHRERAAVAPLDLGDVLRTRDGMALTGLLVLAAVIAVVGAAARAGMLPRVAGLVEGLPLIGLFCGCVWQPVAVALSGLGLAMARWSRRAVHRLADLLSPRSPAARRHPIATVLGALGTSAGVVMALVAAYWAVPVG